MTVALRREAQQRQCTEKGAQFGKGAPFQKHQRSRRRTQSLGSRSHLSSYRAGPLRFGSRLSDMGNENLWGRRKSLGIVPHCNKVSVKTRELHFPFQADATRASTLKTLVVMN